MRRFTNECRGCDTDGYPCRNCGLRRVEHFICDACGDECKLYFYEGKELCIDCIENELEYIEGSDNEW